MIRVKIDFVFHVSFVDMVALVVTGDYEMYDYSQRKIEIIKENFETEVCDNIPEYPLPVRHSAASSWDDGKVTVCGGWKSPIRHSECYSLKNGEWRLTAKLQEGKSGLAASNIGNSIWITGNGFQMSHNPKSHSKFETLVRTHCIVPSSAKSLQTNWTI